MKDNKTETCHDCGHFVMDPESVKVDLTGDTLTATAKYICIKKRKTAQLCEYYVPCHIEDTLLYYRGGDRK